MGAKLSKMLEKFGNVTVMDVKIYQYDGVKDYEDEGDLGDLITTIDSLKISNIMQEGPRKTATGGQNADTLLKYGKTMRLEMQDALGSYDVITKLFGAEGNADDGGNDDLIIITDRFSGPVTIVGETFFIDQATGAKQPVVLVFPKFLPDSIFNIEGDAEGDVGTFDINGDLLAFGETDEGSEVDNKYGPGSDKKYYLITTKEAFYGT